MACAFLILSRNKVSGSVGKISWQALYRCLGPEGRPPFFGQCFSSLFQTQALSKPASVSGRGGQTMSERWPCEAETVRRGREDTGRKAGGRWRLPCPSNFDRGLWIFDLSHKRPRASLVSECRGCWSLSLCVFPLTRPLLLCPVIPLSHDIVLLGGLGAGGRVVSLEVFTPCTLWPSGQVGSPGT